MEWLLEQTGVTEFIQRVQFILAFIAAVISLLGLIWLYKFYRELTAPGRVKALIGFVLFVWVLAAVGVFPQLRGLYRAVGIPGDFSEAYIALLKLYTLFVALCQNFPSIALLAAIVLGLALLGGTNEEA